MRAADYYCRIYLALVQPMRECDHDANVCYWTVIRLKVKFSRVKALIGLIRTLLWFSTIQRELRAFCLNPAKP